MAGSQQGPPFEFGPGGSAAGALAAVGMRRSLAAQRIGGWLHGSLGRLSSRPKDNDWGINCSSDSNPARQAPGRAATMAGTRRSGSSGSHATTSRQREGGLRPLLLSEHAALEAHPWLVLGGQALRVGNQLQAAWLNETPACCGMPYKCTVQLGPAWQVSPWSSVCLIRNLALQKFLLCHLKATSTIQRVHASQVKG